MLALQRQEGSKRVRGPLCKWSASGRNEYSRQETVWLTNCPELAAALEAAPRKGRRTLLESEGLWTVSDQDTPQLVSLKLRALRNQMLQDGGLSAADVLTGGPVPDEPFVKEEDAELYFDDVNGVILPAAEVRKARS